MYSMLRLLEIDLTDLLLCMYYTQNEQNRFFYSHAQANAISKKATCYFFLSLSINQFDVIDAADMYKFRMK